MSKIFYSFIAVAALCFITTTNANAQYKKGDNLLNIGVGLGSIGYGGLPIGASYEYGFTKDISAGASFDYLSWKNVGYSWRITYFGVRGSYHFNELLKLDNDKVDVYGGLGIGYITFGTSDKLLAGYAGYANQLYYALHAGGRYYFSDKVAVFGELGYGIAALKAGVTLKF